MTISSTASSIFKGYNIHETLLVNQKTVIQTLAAQVKENAQIEKALFNLVEESKRDEQKQIAAANAITILNYAGISFSGRDFRKIRISAADLSGAIADGTDFREADLRKVNFSNCWLNNALVANALMENIELGIRLSNSTIHSVCYCPKKRLIAGATAKEIHFWEITSGGATDIYKSIKLLNQIGRISRIAFNEDGSRLVVSGRRSDADNLHVVDIATSKWSTSYKGHTAAINVVAFSPDGRWIISGSRDKTALIWNCSTRELLNVFKHGSEVHSAVCSPDSLYVAVGTENGSISLWNTTTGKQVCILADHMQSGNETSKVNSLTFSHDGKFLASAGEEFVGIWSIETKKCLHMLKNEKCAAKHVVFSPDAALLAARYKNGSVTIWETATGVGSTSYHNGKNTRSIAFNHDGTLFGIGYKKHQVTFNEMPVTNQFANIDRDRIEGISFQDNDIIVAVNHTGVISLRERFSGKCLKTISNILTQITSAVALHPKGALVAIGDLQGHVHLWDLDSAKEIRLLDRTIGSVKEARIPFKKRKTHRKKIEHPQKKMSSFRREDFDKYHRGKDLSSSSNSDSSSSDGLSSSSHKKGFQYYLTSSASSTSGDFESSSDSSLEPAQDLSRGSTSSNSNLQKPIKRHAKRHVEKGHVKTKEDKHARRNGREWQASKSTSDEPKEHSAISFKSNLVDGTHRISSIFFNQDGTLLATKNIAGNLRIWEVSTGKLLFTLKQHSFFKEAAISPDAKLAFPTKIHNEIQVWDILKGEKVATCTGHKDTVLNIAFSSDGKLMASASCDHTVRVWDRDIYDSFTTYKKHSHEVTSVAFSPDSTLIASGCARGSLHIWKNNERSCLAHFDFPHYIQSINWTATNQTESAMAVASGNDIYYFEIKHADTELNVRLIWSSGPSASLSFFKVDVKEAINLSVSNARLLTKYNG